MNFEAKLFGFAGNMLQCMKGRKDPKEGGDKMQGLPEWSPLDRDGEAPEPKLTEMQQHLEDAELRVQEIEDALPGSTPTLLPAELDGNGEGNGADAQERRRVQLLEFFKQPHVADFEMASALASNRAEFKAVRSAKKAHQANDTHRSEWFAHYLQLNDLAEASKLAVTPLEHAKLARLQATRGGLCRCFGGSAERDAAEAHRRQLISDAISTCSWDVANALVVTDSELQEVDLSKMRVEMRSYHKLQGNYERALALSTTDEERQDISEYREEVESSLRNLTPEAEQAIAKLQARLRGRGVRAAKEQRKLERAAVSVQKIYRGYSHRLVEEERRRLAFLRESVDAADYDDAIELAMSKEERDTVLSVKAAREQAQLRNSFFSCLSCTKCIETIQKETS